MIATEQYTYKLSSNNRYRETLFHLLVSTQLVSLKKKKKEKLTQRERDYYSKNL